MRSRIRPSLVAALVGALVLTTAACSPGADPGAAEERWPHTSSPVEADGLVWASGDQVHLPDGSTIDSQGPAGSYVVAGPGVWFTSANLGDLEGNELPHLRVATADGVEDRDAHPDFGSLTTTADGRWLAFIDRLDDGAGPADGERVTTSVPHATGPLGSPDVTGPPLEEWALGGWIDETTVLGITPSRDGFDVDWTTPVLLICTAPTGECTVMEGTEEGVILPADRPFGLPRESSIDPS